MTTTSPTPSQVDGHEPLDGRSLQPVPQPRPMPLLGNVADLRADGGALGFMRLAREYGPIYRLSLPGGDLAIDSSITGNTVALLVTGAITEGQGGSVVATTLNGSAALRITSFA